MSRAVKTRSRTATAEQTATLNLTPDDLAMFAKFRTAPDLLAAAGIRRVTDEVARREFGLRHQGDLSGIVFPYYDKTRAEVNFRLRLDTPIKDKKGKDIKYIGASRRARRRLLYWPPGAFELLANPETEVLLVEAEKSALAITAAARRAGRKIVAIAIGGCWGWRSKHPDPTDQKKEISTALPDLDLLRDRKHVGVMMDTNVANNDSVAMAERTLAAELGAKRYRVPAESHVNGPDDFIAGHTDEEFWAFLAKPEAEREIDLTLDPLNVQIDKAWRVQSETADKYRLYPREGDLVHVVEEQREVVEQRLGFRRPHGNTFIQRTGEGTFIEMLSEERCVVKTTYTPEGKVKAICPVMVPPTRLGQAAMTRLRERPEMIPGPRLVAISNLPLLFEDGTLVDEPGFHRASGVWFAPQEYKFPKVPARPTKEHAKAALDQLWPVFEKVSFAMPDGCNQKWKSPAYAAVLATIVGIALRHLLPTVPLLGITAPEAGSGKTKIAEAIGAATTGRRIARISYDNTEEFDKQLPIPLGCGDRVVLIDNVDRKMLRSARLSMVLSTEASIKWRILGETREQTVVNRSVFIATGNHLVISGDLPRRSMLCRLTPDTSSPETRQFDFDPPTRALERFPKLAVAVLTAARYYLQAGCPAPEYAANVAVESGSFTEWNRTVRGMLVHLGFGDPLATQQEVRKENPMLASAVALARALHVAFPGGSNFSASKIKKLPPHSEAIALLLGADRTWDPQIVGFRLAELRDRVLDGLKVTYEGHTHGVASYSVAEFKENR